MNPEGARLTWPKMWLREIRPALQEVRRKRAAARLWDDAETFQDLCELTAQFLEGKLQETPSHYGPRDPETVEIAAPLAHANRQGFLTDNSEPGRGLSSHGYEQNADVVGLADSETVEQLRRLVRGTRLAMTVTSPSRMTQFSPGRWDEPGLLMEVGIWDPQPGPSTLLWDRLGQLDWDNPAPLRPDQRATDNELRVARVARSPWRTWSGLSETPEEPDMPDTTRPRGWLPWVETKRCPSCGCDSRRRTPGCGCTSKGCGCEGVAAQAKENAGPDGQEPWDYHCDDDACSCEKPPGWWSRRRDQEWGRPPEPPVGTVLETRDAFDEYRIEHLPEGWALQYRDGESEHDDAHMHEPISWESAWRAWGPPAGAQPFTEVPPGSLPLPPAPPEETEPPLALYHPNASSAVLDSPPAAEPYTPPGPVPADETDDERRWDGRLDTLDDPQFTHDEIGLPLNDRARRFYRERMSGYTGWLDENAHRVDPTEQARLNAVFDRQRPEDPGVDAGSGADLPPAAEPYTPPGPVPADETDDEHDQRVAMESNAQNAALIEQYLDETLPQRAEAPEPRESELRGDPDDCTGVLCFCPRCMARLARPATKPHVPPKKEAAVPRPGRCRSCGFDFCSCSTRHWHVPVPPDKPTTAQPSTPTTTPSSTTSPGGTPMSDVSQARAKLGKSDEHSGTAGGALQHAHQETDEALKAAMAAAEESSQADYAELIAMLQRQLGEIVEKQQMNAAIAEKTTELAGKL